jgi:hypothetical protein
MGEPSDFDGSVMKREPSPDEPEGRIRFRVAGIQSGPRNQLATEPQYKRETSSDHSRSPEDHIGALIHGGVVEPRFIRRVKADVAVLPIDDATPREVFAHTLEGRPLRDSFHATGLERMVRYEQPDEILVYTSGQTIRKNRGNTGARLSGCAIIFGREDLLGRQNSWTKQIEAQRRMCCASCSCGSSRDQDLGFGRLEKSDHRNGPQDHTRCAHPAHREMGC